MSRQANAIREQIAAVPSLTDEELGYQAGRVANHYMLYAVKPLPEFADRTPRADALRAETMQLLGELWLAITAESERRR